MYTLGIETSCDETSVSVVENGRRVLSNIVASSLNLHKRYGGIIPEIASRAQLESIYPVAQEALKEARVRINAIRLIAVTYGPGLNGSLLIGVSFAKALSLACNIALIGINHIKSHIYAPLLSRNTRAGFPFVGLVISGGHTSLFLVKDFDRFIPLGQTVDDAAGEAFDKVARILGLGYPGGPLVEKLALRGRANKVKFSCGNLDRELDFSFSGIKTAVLYKIKNQKSRIKNTDKADIAYAFQEAVFDDIIKKTVLACLKKKVKSLLVGGGVVCNNRFRLKLGMALGNQNIKTYIAEPKYCLDNAAMVAGLGYQLYKKGVKSKLSLGTEPT